MSDWKTYVTPAAVVGLTPLIVGALRRSARFQARHENGIAWLEYGPAMKGFTALCCLLVASLCVIWFIVQPKDRAPVFFMILLFGGLTLPLVLECFLVRIGFDAERIYCRSGWRPRRVIPWSEVQSVKFSPAMQWWVIKTSKSGNIRVQVFISGARELLGELHKRGIQDPVFRPLAR
jgi:hypothetical protein